MAGVVLEYGDLRMVLQPDSGGCIAGLWYGEVPVLRSMPAAQLHSVRISACYPLVPFSNRIGNAQMHWANAVYPLTPNFAPEAHAIHGAVWERSWAVVTASNTTATLRYTHLPDVAWPFAFTCVQTFLLDDQGVTMSLQVTNEASHLVPVGLGWHPFFVKRPASHVQFEAAGRWAMGQDKLPTVRQTSTGLDCACQALEIDHCFDGWAGMLHLRDGQFHTQLYSSLNHLVVFTHPSKDFIAIEPVSHVNNALGAVRSRDTLAALGMRVLQPQATTAAWMQLKIKPI